MQLPQALLLYRSAMAATGSLFAWFDEACSRSLAFLQAFYSTIGVPVLRQLSRLFQDALLHPGSRALNDHLVSIVLAASLIAGGLALMVLWRMLGTGIRIEKAAFKPIDGDAPQSTGSFRGVITGYFRSLIDRLLEGLILFWGIVVMATVLFVVCKTLWFSYLASPVGRLYPFYFPQRARLIGMLLGQDMFSFPFVLTVIAFGSGMIFSGLCRFFYLTRYIYLPRGIVGRILLLVLPLNLLAAATLRPIFPHPHWGAAYAATLIPTLLSFGFCFRFTNRFLPELGMLLRVGNRKHSAPMHRILLRNLNVGKAVLEFDPISGRPTGKRFPWHDGVQTQGLFLSRRGHDLILYRYGRDLFFQMDDLELTLTVDMSVQRLEKGRYRRRFELSRDGTRMLRLNWSIFSMVGARVATTVFLESLEGILQHREAYERAFIIYDDPEQPENDLSD